MSSATGGYVSGIDYLYDFQPETSPLRVEMALLGAGIAPPRIATACELGFGQGLGVNIHAAAQDVRWYGTDFNPVQVGFARQLAAASGADVQLCDQSFAEFCARPDLPDFDLIVLHGVWTWINHENQALLVDFLRRKLAAGGVACISYNVQPGFSELIPLHAVLMGHAAAFGRSGAALAPQVGAALEFAERVLAVSPGYMGGHPRVLDLLRSMRAYDRRYLAHEYLNANWAPTSFARVAEALAGAGLKFACSPGVPQSPASLELSMEQRALLAQIPDQSYREVVRDLMVNRRFRIDYWVKGARRLDAPERIERLLGRRVMLVRQPAEAQAGFAKAYSAPFHPALTAVIGALADHRPRPLAELCDALAPALDAAQLCAATVALVDLEAVAAVQGDAPAQAARPRTDELNALLRATALRGADVRALASPVTGTGYAADGGRIALFFLDAMVRGLREPRALAAHALGIFRALGIGLFRDGQPIGSPDESLALVTAQSQYFLDRQLPLLRALWIA
ncbi:MAG TPA: class I SAM-dependent methyltransferase [Steroidobacteraceae bacterium]|nr:class I SAM-dependent methyltransferase [Steroidobacteraceae bacterium]